MLHYPGITKLSEREQNTNKGSLQYGWKSKMHWPASILGMRGDLHAAYIKSKGTRRLGKKFHHNAGFLYYIIYIFLAWQVQLKEALGASELMHVITYAPEKGYSIKSQFFSHQSVDSPFVIWLPQATLKGECFRVRASVKNWSEFPLWILFR